MGVGWCCVRGEERSQVIINFKSRLKKGITRSVVSPLATIIIRYPPVILQSRLNLCFVILYIIETILRFLVDNIVDKDIKCSELTEVGGGGPSIYENCKQLCCCDKL